jgi:SARP family transcriptional regulator, regulator of embCAB operon
VILAGETRLQLCGRMVVRIDGKRLEDALPGRQGRLLLVYLVLNRLRPVRRDELLAAIWPERQPDAADTALSALLSKLRRVLGSEVLPGRGNVRLELPAGAFVDVEAAGEAIHRAEAAVRRGAWAEAWGPARVALHTALRDFLPGEDAPWVGEERRRLDEIALRAHECVAASGLGLGGAELDSAKRSARALIAAAPYRESGYRFLMLALRDEGNAAEALQVYEQLRQLLREELGASPSPSTQELHRELLGA